MCSQQGQVGPEWFKTGQKMWAPNGFVCSFRGDPICVWPYWLKRGLSVPTFLNFMGPTLPCSQTMGRRFSVQLLLFYPFPGPLCYSLCKVHNSWKFLPHRSVLHFTPFLTAMKEDFLKEDISEKWTNTLMRFSNAAFKKMFMVTPPKGNTSFLPSACLFPYPLAQALCHPHSTGKLVI